MIKKSQFDILTYLLKSNKYTSQRDLAEAIQISLGAVNNEIRELSKRQYVEDGKITEAGKNALKPYRVQRAVFIAAGFGSRLLPITLNTPKPLIKVDGKMIIETALDAVLKAGIDEIYIVRGYLSENFDILLKKYPMIKFIENEEYNESNNITSALAVKDKFKNSYVLDGDIILYNQDLITPYQYSSNYLGVSTDRTDDWCLKTKSGKITEMNLGGRNCFQMMGLSYWTQRDGKKLEGHIEEVYKTPGGKERFWEQVVFDFKKEDYDVSIRECNFNDIVEIDTFKELKEIDNTYDI